MSPRFPISRLPCVNHLFSRALTTICRHVGSDPEDDFVCFSLNANASKEDSINLIAQLHQQNGSLQNPYFLNKIISFCVKSALYDVGIQVHWLIVKMGFTSNPYICTALVHMYGKCSEILSSEKLSDEIPHRNVVAYGIHWFWLFTCQVPRNCGFTVHKNVERGNSA